MAVEKNLSKDTEKIIYDYIPRSYIEDKIKIITNEAIIADREGNEKRYSAAVQIVAVLDSLLKQYDFDNCEGEA